MAEPARSWRDGALVQLTISRLREVSREPEAIFWTFLFPVLMAAGLGLVLLLGLASGFLPAWQAGRLRIVDALRRN